MEMVIFLNSLYKMFDARIDKYDVYKVQAINDSFMLASGIPTQVKAKVYSWLDYVVHGHYGTMYFSCSKSM